MLGKHVENDGNITLNWLFLGSTEPHSSSFSLKLTTSSSGTILPR